MPRNRKLAPLGDGRFTLNVDACFGRERPKLGEVTREAILMECGRIRLQSSRVGVHGPVNVPATWTLEELEFTVNFMKAVAASRDMASLVAKGLVDHRGGMVTEAGP